MIYWAPFLHFYQPPTQFHTMLQKICNQSYRPLLKIFNESPRAKVTINISGILTEMLNSHGGEDIIKSISHLAESGKLEFVESAKYHPILPLIPYQEISRQIDLNNKTNSSFFKGLYKPRGFFSPEMCYSDGVAGIVSGMGYEWMILAGMACSCSETWPLDFISGISTGKNKLAIFYRDDVLSNKISFHGIDSKGFVSELIALSKGGENIYVITAMDAETFGHHIEHWEDIFLKEVYETLEKSLSEQSLKQRVDLAEKHRDILDSKSVDKIEVVTISELLNQFPIKTSKAPLQSSWSTSKDEINTGNYYPLWMNKSNPIHKLQWEHIDICFELVEKAMNLKVHNRDSKYFADISRSIMDRAIYSCQFWWANKGRTFDINLINKGLMLQEEVLLNAYKAILVSDCEDRIKKDSYHILLAARYISNKIQDQLLEV